MTIRPRSLIFVNAEAVKRYAAVFAPSFHHKNHSEICDLSVNKYWGTGSKKIRPTLMICKWDGCVMLSGVNKLIKDF